MSSIRKTLYHELAHNVHGDHDDKFYQLMRQIEKECTELDWTKHPGGKALGGQAYARIPDLPEQNSIAPQQPLGGKFSGPISREQRAALAEERQIKPVKVVSEPKVPSRCISPSVGLISHRSN